MKYYKYPSPSFPMSSRYKYEDGATTIRLRKVNETVKFSGWNVFFETTIDGFDVSKEVKVATLALAKAAGETLLLQFQAINSAP